MTTAEHTWRKPKVLSHQVELSVGNHSALVEPYSLTKVPWMKVNYYEGDRWKMEGSVDYGDYNEVIEMLKAFNLG